MDRRTFLRRGFSTAALVGALGGTTGRLWAQDDEQAAGDPPVEGEEHDGHAHEEREPVVGMKKGIPLSEVQLEGSLQEQFQLLKDMGFDGVELESPMGLRREAYVQRRTELLEATQETGLEIYSVKNRLDVKFPLSDPDSMAQKRAFSSLATAVADAAIFKARYVRTVAGVVNEEISYDDAYVSAFQAVQSSLRIAEQANTQVALENTGSHFLLSPLELASFADDLANEHVGVHLDVASVRVLGWPEHWIRILGSRLVTVGLRNFSGEKANKEGVPNGFDVGLLEGDVKWERVMAALREVRPNGWFTVAVPGGSEERLFELVDEVDQILAM